MKFTLQDIQTVATIAECSEEEAKLSLERTTTLETAIDYAVTNKGSIVASVGQTSKVLMLIAYWLVGA